MHILVHYNDHHGCWSQTRQQVPKVCFSIISHKLILSERHTENNGILAYFCRVPPIAEFTEGNLRDSYRVKDP